jgi:hypothetical protein
MKMRTWGSTASSLYPARKIRSSSPRWEATPLLLASDFMCLTSELHAETGLPFATTHSLYLSRLPGTCKTVLPCAFHNAFARLLNRRHFVPRVPECSISTSGRKWDKALPSFSVLCCTISTQFHRFTLLPRVRFQNMFTSKANFKIK